MLLGPEPRKYHDWPCLWIADTTGALLGCKLQEVVLSRGFHCFLNPGESGPDSPFSLFDVTEFLLVPLYKSSFDSFVVWHKGDSALPVVLH